MGWKVQKYEGQLPEDHIRYDIVAGFHCISVFVLTNKLFIEKSYLFFLFYT